MCRSRRAFTLIELLVVIAIIAILAAILFPVFAKAREKARQNSCLSNTKQLGTGLVQYAQDYDETYPTHFWGEGNAGQANSSTWWGGIFPYVKNVQVYSCPSRSSNAFTTTGNGWTFAVWANFNTAFLKGNVCASNHYGYNELMGNQGAGMKLANLRSPADSLILGDCTAPWGGGYWSSTDRSQLVRYMFARGGAPCGCPPTLTNNEDWALHNGGSNLIFVDGHAKWYKWSNIKTTVGGGSIRYYDTEW